MIFIKLWENGGIAPLNLTIDGSDHFYALPCLVPVKGSVELTGLAPEMVAKRKEVTLTGIEPQFSSP